MSGRVDGEGGIEKTPRQKPGWRLVQMADQWLLHHPSQAGVVQVNQSAALIWGLCDGRTRLSELVDLLTQAYPESAEGIPGDVEAAVLMFIEKGCLEWQEGPP